MIQSNDLPSAESVSGASYRDYAPVDSRDRSSLLHSGLTQPSLTCPRIIYRTPLILESRADDCRRTYPDRAVGARTAPALGRLAERRGDRARANPSTHPPTSGRPPPGTPRHDRPGDSTNATRHTH